MKTYCKEEFYQLDCEVRLVKYNQSSNYSSHSLLAKILLGKLYFAWASTT